MCGIAGVISAKPLSEDVRSAVRRMNVAMGHRGPDDEGYYFDENLALAMRRLSIIDVKGGRQPLHGEQDDTVIVCNGEIYNYVELRRELEGRNHRFNTHSDVETILPLYRELGAECTTRLRGMFAFALWDRKSRQLLLARDRFGEKPLYLCRQGDCLWFASEMKALLSGLEHTKMRLSAAAAHLFLVYQFVPEPRTMLEGVTKLPAGHHLVVTPELLANEQGVPDSRAYWNYRDAAPRNGDPVSQVRATLEEASRITLRADVPVGIALSGGIDSGLIAALARKFHSGELRAFSVGYPGRPENDERKAAESLARHLDMPFFDVELSSDDFVEMFPQIVHDMDDPISDIAAYGYHAVSGLAREHGVPVLLSGIGADELFWGYDWVRQGVLKTIDKSKRRLPSWVARLIDAHPNRAVFFDSLEWMRDAAALADRLMTPEAATSFPTDLWTSYFESDDWKDIPIWLLDVLNKTWLVSNCLSMCDRLSMAHSVELRLPFLDFQLADLVNGLRRAGMDDWNRPHKWLMIQAIRDLLPTEILERKKRGFTPPVNEWMGRVVARYAPLLRDGVLTRNCILVENVDKLMGRAGIGFSYRVVLLEMWARVFLQSAAPQALLAECEPA